MADSAVYFLAVLVNFSQGQTAVIETQQTVVAAAGGEAQLNCQLLQSTEILEVTWQKVLPGGEKSLSSSHKDYGTKVNPEFKDKMEFRYTGLQSCSIVIRNTTVQDEGCYHCLFITFPGVSLKGTTCLHVYELHEPVLRVGQSDSSAESLVSCSATGRPAPTVTLNVKQQHLHFSHHNTVSVDNNNGTVTVTTTAVLSGFHGNGTQVGCAARLLSGPQMEAVVMIPASDEESGPNQRRFRTPLIIVFLLLAACGCVAAIVLLRKKPHNRDHDMNEEPPTTIKDTQETETPSVEQDNNELRRWETPQKNEEPDKIPSPLAER